MSNNQSGPQLPLSSINKLFFVATFKDRGVAIRRNDDLTTTISSIRRTFPALAHVHYSRIRLMVRFSELGDRLIEISHELWPEILPLVMDVDVSIADEDDIPVEPAPEPSSTEIPILDKQLVPVNSQAKPERIVLYIHDERGRIKELALPVLSTTTIQQLKSMIVEHSTQLPQYLILSHESNSSIQDHKQLYQCGIRDGSTISISTEFEVNLRIAKDTIYSVTVYTGANAHILMSLAAAEMKGETEFDPFKLVMTCAGHTLKANQILGSCSYITPGCEIFCNESNKSIRSFQLSVKPRSPSNDGGETNLKTAEYQLPVATTVLEVKFLIFNSMQIPMSRQVLDFNIGSYSTSTNPPDWFTFENNLGTSSPAICYLKVE